MQIVINIPEKVNNRLRSTLGHGYCLRDEDAKIIAEAIYNGQTQPKEFEWCRNCKEYDSVKHCCPRFNRVIRNAMKDAQPEVIRCGECKHSFLHDNGEKISRICGLTRMCGTTPDDWFCADAERREE